MIFKPKHQIKNPWWVKTIPHIIIVCLIINAAIIIISRHNIDSAAIGVLSAFYGFCMLCLSVFGYSIQKDKLYADALLKITMILWLLAILGTTVFVAVKCIPWLQYLGAIFLIKKRGGNSRLRIG